MVPGGDTVKPVAAPEREAGGEKIVQMADCEKADRDNPRQFRGAFERVNPVGHYRLLNAPPTAIHHCSACRRGFAIASIAPADSTAPTTIPNTSAFAISGYTYSEDSVARLLKAKNLA